ncbi:MULTISPECIES: PEPxxWA-CTERM sorting domain-containing protein [Sphingomonas]|uniref:PEPxxWA-CTERM sorting domain-containing protein n=1 Tax=Sphingomonas TaxID=13687 RepID=UPI000DEF1D2F|nr:MULTISPECIES: PEPxxWA-CTERM sorting domain-containing protein [Sphingomonas]
MRNARRSLALTGAVGAAAFLALAAAPASAAVVVTPIGVNYGTTPYTFSIGESTFTFSGTGDIFGPTAISTGGTGMVNTIFGSPTTNFVDRGTVTFGPDSQYGSFSTASPIRFSNGNNFIGLSATLNGATIYGYAYTTNSVLNSIGFQTTPGTAITATTAIPSAVPEPATWLTMLIGFGAIGASIRLRRRRPTAVAAA